MFNEILICFLLNLCCFSVCSVDFPKKKSLIIDYMSENNFIHTKKEMNCDSDLYKLYCRSKCEEKRNTLGICLEGNCYCVMDDKPEKLPSSKPTTQNVWNQVLKNNVSKNPGASNDTNNESNKNFFNVFKKSILRHQIAHFCVNIKAAKTCVRKCMAKGKPAFCGKDHVCYCGHKYADTKNSDDAKIDDVYAQFKDLYEKYFPNVLNSSASESSESTSD